MVDMNDFDLNTVDGIDEAIKALRESRKEIKKAETLANRQAAKAEKEQKLQEAKDKMESLNLEEGDNIRFILKGEEVEGEFVKITAARFVATVDGEKKTLPFDKFLSVADEVAEAV